MFKLSRESGDALAQMELSCTGTDHERAFSFTSTLSAGGATFDLQVAETKQSQGAYPTWKSCDLAGAQQPLRIRGHFGQLGFIRVSRWEDEKQVVASAMVVMDSMGDYVRDVFVFRGDILDKRDAEARSQTPGCLLAFVKDRKSNDGLPYQKPAVKQGSVLVQLADELQQQGPCADLSWAVFMLLGITLAGLDAGRRYYTQMGAGSSGDGTGPTPADAAWGSLIH